MRILILVLISIFLWQCSQPANVIPLEIPRDGLYDSAYPHTDVSVQLNRLSESVLKIYFTAYYKNYFFDRDSQVQRREIDDALKNIEFRDMVTFSRSSFGTATVVSNENNSIVLLSCAHIGSFPDTLITLFQQPGSQRGEQWVESVAIKQKSTHFIEHDFLKGNLEILAVDNERDLALFGIKQSRSDPFTLRPFPYPFGNMEDLTWGSLVYMMGYPIGHKMVTQGMVSPPEDDDDGTFIVDALFNKGFSGGVVLAVKDGVPNFELVGLAKSISAQTEFYLSPDSRNMLNYSQSLIPYEGDMFVTPQRSLHYGVTYCISIDAIHDFIQENTEEIEKIGYSITCYRK